MKNLQPRDLFYGKKTIRLLFPIDVIFPLFVFSEAATMLDSASPTSTQYCAFAKKICTDNGQYHCTVFLRSPNPTLLNIASEICGDAIQLMSIDGLLQVLKIHG